MRLAPVVATMLLLLLIGLSFHATSTEADLFDQDLAALDQFTIVESELQRDVLSARVGTLRNYDPLVHETNDLDALLPMLRRTAKDNMETATAVDRLAATVARQDALVEQFKSNNALLQNSLAYFGLYGTQLSGLNAAEPLISTAGGLVSAMLHLTLDTSPATAHEVATWLDALARQPPSPAQAALIHGLLAHGRLLHAILPATDEVLKHLRAIPQKRERDALRAIVLQRQSESRTTANRLRLLLYVTSLLLLAGLIYLGMQLQARALALRRRVALEHAIAGISTRFIDLPARILGRQVENALAELAEHVGADRAYFISGGGQVQHFAWCRNGHPLPKLWLHRAAELVAGLPASADGVINIPVVERLPTDEAKRTLVSAGLHSWMCVFTPCPEGGNALLGFDGMRPGHVLQAEEPGPLRTVLNAMANAVKRDALEQAGARLKQRLQQSRRMETVGALTTGIAHNFNNIIAAILGYAEIAEATVAPNTQPARDIAEVRRAGERARDLVDQIMDFGRRRDTRRAPVNVQELVTESASLLHVSLPPGISLAIHNASEPAVIFGEIGQLQQVILNLCHNAAQAMDGSGRVTLAVEVKENEKPRMLSHGSVPPGRYVCIAVADSGRGMDAMTLGRIFEPFFTTRLTGNGLGLATVREIVREHNGAIHVTSTPQAGSRFDVWLPCGTADDEAPAEGLSPMRLGRGETVLVVDEDRAQVLRDEEVLAALGYEPVGFAGADDALAACRATPNRFDILVVGHFVPASAALSLAAELHVAAPHLPLLLAAARPGETAAEAVVAAGIADVIQWPMVATELAAALADCLAARKLTPRAGKGAAGTADV